MMILVIESLNLTTQMLIFFKNDHFAVSPQGPLCGCGPRVKWSFKKNLTDLLDLTIQGSKSLWNFKIRTIVGNGFLLTLKPIKNIWNFGTKYVTYSSKQNGHLKKNIS